jgi:N-acetylmuramoyl-L-alanine amidase
VSSGLVLRVFFVLFVLTGALYATTTAQTLQRADKLITTKSASNIFSAYNDYKNLYLQAVVKGDRQLRYSALVGIVKSGRLLHIDVNSYTQELRKFQKTQSSGVQHNRIRKLISIRWHDGDLVLRFNHALSSNDLNYFTLKDKYYKYILDIKAFTSTHYRTLHKRGISKIQIIREDRKRIRVLVTNSRPLDLHYFIDENSIVIQIKRKAVIKREPKKIQKVVHVKQTDINYNLPFLSRRHKIIVLDPGHGGKDPGATGYLGYHEKNVVLAIGLKLDKILEQRGYTVYMTRRTDRFITLRNRTNFANKEHADLFISIHANAVSYKERDNAYGIETYFLSLSDNARAARVAGRENSVDMSDMNYYGKSTFITFITNHNRIASNKLAIDVQSSILMNLRKHYRHVTDAGVREGPFWVLVGAQMPAILIETGFITNPREARRLVNPKYQKQLAIGVANGVDKFFLLRRR